MASMRSLRPAFSASLLLLSAAACSPESSAGEEECPPGTYRDEGECVATEGAIPDLDAEPSDAEVSGGDDDDGTSDPEADGWDDVEPDPETPDPPTEVEDEPEPEDGSSDPSADEGSSAAPEFPSTIGRLSFAVKTGGGTHDGSNGQFEVCLDDRRCFKLDVPAVDDFRRGDFDVYHYANVDMPRARVDRVEIRHVGGGDMWQPVCIETRFDGEPVQCSEGLPPIGNGGGRETRRHRMALRNQCGTCYPSRITHGPLVGAVGAADARLLVRTDASRPVRIQVAEAARPNRVVTTVGPRWPSPANDYTQSFRITGLSPRTEYIARVLLGDHVTPADARFRTAPPDGRPSRFRVAMGSCANNHNVRPAHPIFDTIRQKDPEVFIFLGDNHYGNTGNIQGLWWNYRDTWSMAARARLGSRTSTLAIWDDHDFTGNDSNRHAAGRGRALRAFKDYWANGSYGNDATPGIFSKTSHGDVDFFLLDTRYHRDRPDNGGSILGDAQLQWLKNQLRTSTASFKILASGSLFSRSGGETWTDYATRAQLFRFIRENDIRGVVLLAGDIHHSSLRRIRRSDGYDIPEIVASGLANAQNSDCHPGPDDYTQFACLGGRGSFAVLDIDTTLDNPRIIARLIDEGGTQRGRSMEIRKRHLR